MRDALWAGTTVARRGPAVQRPAGAGQALLALQAQIGNAATASLVAQRLSFKRTWTGAIGGMLGRADTDADQWMKAYESLRKIVASLQQRAMAPGHRTRLLELQQVVDQLEALDVEHTQREAVGAKITDALERATKLSAAVARWRPPVVKEKRPKGPAQTPKAPVHAPVATVPDDLFDLAPVRSTTTAPTTPKATSTEKKRAKKERQALKSAEKKAEELALAEAEEAEAAARAAEPINVAYNQLHDGTFNEPLVLRGTYTSTYDTRGWGGEYTTATGHGSWVLHVHRGPNGGLKVAHLKRWDHRFTTGHKMTLSVEKVVAAGVPQTDTTRLPAGGRMHHT